MSARALHSAARRYCMERLDALAHAHGHPPVAMNAEQLAAWMGRVAVLGILEAIERVQPAAFPTADALRRHLLESCSRAIWPEGRVRDNPERESDAAIAERARFLAYVSHLSEQAARRLPTVPARRAITPEERHALLRRIASAWPADGGRWHPHAAALKAAEVLPLRSRWIGTEELPVEPVRRALATLAGPSIWELHEGAPWWIDDVGPCPWPQEGSVSGARPSWPAGYELNPMLWWITGGSESLWTAPTLDWLLYAHHEGTLYVVGTSLVRAIKEAWPVWEQHIWTSPFDPSPTSPPYIRQLR
jgi:hypothetical protein